MVDPKDLATFSALLVLLMGLFCLYIWGNCRTLKDKIKRQKAKLHASQRYNTWLSGRLDQAKEKGEEPQRRILVITPRVPDGQPKQPVQPTAAEPKPKLPGPARNGHPGAGSGVPGTHCTTTCHTQPVRQDEADALRPFVPPPLSEVPQRADRC